MVYDFFLIIDVITELTLTLQKSCIFQVLSVCIQISNNGHIA